MAKFEEEYLDVLQNIESALVSVYREDAEMTDWKALDAVNGLIRTYTAEIRRRAAPDLNLNDLTQVAYDRVQGMCEWRLGRTSFETETGEALNLGEQALEVSEIIDCLKRIRKSIQMWNKELGRRGYFDFVNGFLP